MSPAKECGNPATENHPKVPAARSATVQGHCPSQVLSEPEHSPGGIRFNASCEWILLLLEQVVDRQAVGRGVTGWCRPARQTSCHPIQQVNIPSFVLINNFIKITVVIIILDWIILKCFSTQASVEYHLNSSLVQVNNNNNNDTMQCNAM